MRNLAGKVVVITGAASGIGFGLAKQCAREGMKVVLAGINRNNLVDAEKTIKQIGAPTLIVPTDVSKAGDVELLAKKTLKAFGTIDLLVNNAGVLAGTTTWESTLNDWEWVLRVNLFGVIHGIHTFVPIMLNQGTECHIVNTASSGGLLTLNRQGVYFTSKHAIVALSETLYREMIQRGTRLGVSVLCAGFIATRLLDAERNRPLQLKNEYRKAQKSPEPANREYTELIKRLHSQGMAPEACAEFILDAVKENKFYIFPNMAVYKPGIRLRMDDITNERNPTPWEPNY